VLINPFISKTGEEHKTLNQHRIWQHTMLTMLLHADAFSGWAQTDYQSRHCTIDQKDGGT
jgi:hypothetical protein